MPRILHTLAQRPGFTGSGITLQALVRHASLFGWEQRVVVGGPEDDSSINHLSINHRFVRPLVFGRDPLDFPVPGMSDVMPYPSSRFSELDEDQLAAYRNAWLNLLNTEIAVFRPDIIHTHHVWLMSSLLKDVASDIPVVTHCHATGFRQMELCPHIAEEVRRKCSRNDSFCVLHRGHAAKTSSTLGIPGSRIHVVGAGYRQDLFTAEDRSADPGQSLLYVGKLSAAKGLPWLLDAVERISESNAAVRLHVVGDGAGEQAEELRRRMEEMVPTVIIHGTLGQEELAKLMRSCAVCVLPSFYEGLPLVLVEAAACGCRLVATALGGVVDQLLPQLNKVLTLVPVPRLVAVDTPHADDVDAFVSCLQRALESALGQPPVDDSNEEIQRVLRPFSWAVVFRRVQAVWREAMPAVQAGRI